MMSLSPWKCTLFLLVAFLLAACSSAPKLPPPQIFNVTANPQANNGTLFYFVVRRANEKQFMLESYQDVAGKTFSDPPDPNSLGVFSIVPGTKQACEVNLPAQGTLGLYFLFTQPGSQWKKLLSLPLGDSYLVNLTATGKVEINEDQPWYSLF